MTPRRSYSAPGKLFLFGEYAVLRGAPAIITAVDRRVTASPTDDPYRVVGVDADEGLPRAVAAETGATTDGWQVDVTALMEGEGEERLKLGLGSSAASCVALCAAVLGSDDPAVVGPAADRAHRAFQGGRGSGGDVAASTWGGTIRYCRGETPAPLVWPDDLHITAVWMGAAANTRSFVDAVRQAPTGPVLEEMAALAVAVAGNFSAPNFVEHVRAWDELLERLGQTAGVPIRTPAHRWLAEWATGIGAAAKPSGAGGGDVSLVVSSRPIGAEDAPKGLEFLDFALHAEGVRAGR